jgi:hypothetical protein
MTFDLDASRQYLFSLGPMPQVIIHRVYPNNSNSLAFIS